MCLYDHRTTLLSLHVVNFSGRTDTETGRGFILFLCFRNATLLPHLPVLSVSVSVIFVSL